MPTKPTIVFFHAHPDDESSQTSGSMARASAEGSRVVVVYATNGDHGEAPADLAPGETVVMRRRKEAEESAAATGTARVAWLGYADSGMTGWEQNSAAESFHLADTDEAARRLADLLDEEDADILVGYDWHGNYGHPDHIKVHHVGHRAAELATRRPRVLEGTMNRSMFQRMYELAAAAGMAGDWDPNQLGDDGQPMGTPEEEITWRVDVTAYLPQRRASLEAHASQTSDVGQMLAIPEPAFTMMFGHEHYLEPGLESDGMRDGWPFGDAPA